MEEEIHPKAHEFDGSRFLKLHEKEGDEIIVAPVLLGFGLGRHTW